MPIGVMDRSRLRPAGQYPGYTGSWMPDELAAQGIEKPQYDVIDTLMDVVPGAIAGGRMGGWPGAVIGGLGQGLIGAGYGIGIPALIDKADEYGLGGLAQAASMAAPLFGIAQFKNQKVVPQAERYYAKSGKKILGGPFANEADAIEFTQGLAQPGVKVTMTEAKNVLPKGEYEKGLQGKAKMDALFGRFREDYKLFDESMKGISSPELLAPNRLKLGNSKLNTYIFDLPAGLTCGSCKTAGCLEKCYATKAQLQYPDAADFRNGNMWLAKNQPQIFEDSINNQLAKIRKGGFKSKGENIVRIHSSGDFMNQDYLNRWARIVKQNPDFQFYAYTKQDKRLDFTPLTDNTNFNLVKSLLPNGEINFGKDIEKLNRHAKEFGIPEICPATMGSDVKCGGKGGCKNCLTSPYMVFKEH